MVEQVYRTVDGKIHESRDAAEEHERELMTETEIKVQHFLNTYSGRSLLCKHSLEEMGVWEVRGEDPNCDMGGYHHRPLLFRARGKLRDVIGEAVNYASFYTWGAGGEIVPYNDKMIDLT